MIIGPLRGFPSGPYFNLAHQNNSNPTPFSYICFSLLIEPPFIVVPKTLAAVTSIGA